MDSVLDKFLEELNLRLEERITHYEQRRDEAIKHSRLDEAHSYYMTLCGIKETQLIVSQTQRLV